MTRAFAQNPSTASALRRALVWLAFGLILFGALAPGISKLLAAQRDVAWVEVCTAQGVQFEPVGKASSKAPADGHDATDPRCGYCLLQHHSPMLPTVASAPMPGPGLTGRLRIGSAGTTVVLRAERDAHPARAPPVFS